MARRRALDSKNPDTPRANVAIGILGSVLDGNTGARRFEKWRPTVALCQQPDLPVDRLELLVEPKHKALGELVVNDIGKLAKTQVRLTELELGNPWDFETVFSALHDFARTYPFRPDEEDYFVHITTGTHVAQICLFLLTESRHFPGKLLQTRPGPKDRPAPGHFSVIDLDLSRYDRIAARFERERAEGVELLKAGIQTRNERFNSLIDRLGRVALASDDPILLTGATGVGKSQLAKRVFALKKARRRISGELVEVNCATLVGEGAMSALFGHVRGAFTGAEKARDGLLRKADGGLLFLDEIGELGLDEQAMLLRAIEEKTFLPVGSDSEVKSEFSLIAGTNRDLSRAVEAGAFREDLLARIDLWAFRLPSIVERREDLEPNLDFELERLTEKTHRRVTMSVEARQRFLELATSQSATWPGNFRDFASSITRMATLAPGGRIDLATVEEELERLLLQWTRLAGAVPKASQGTAPLESNDLVSASLGPRAAELDEFDRAQLERVIRVCKEARTLSAAGRILFAASRSRRSSINDADRLRKYLARFGLSIDQLRKTLKVGSGAEPLREAIRESRVRKPIRSAGRIRSEPRGSDGGVRIAESSRLSTNHTTPHSLATGLRPAPHFQMPKHMER
ncbi:MAG: sigma 54-interacting transcriptional regulator [Deltaproteobacteria bacterium]|nr:sigma 54-interacting transcriptional regulator [Deltaproteobacteria bacterium]